jgi:hypothetical protein
MLCSPAKSQLTAAFIGPPSTTPLLIYWQVGVPILLIVGSALHQHLNFNVTIVIFSGLDISNLIGCTNSYVDPDGPPQHLELEKEVIDNERLPPSGAPGPTADTAGHRQEHTLVAKRMLGASCSLFALSAPSKRRRHGKQQKMHRVCEDLCCFCLIAATCSLHNCPCAKAGRPCRCCDPGVCNRCTNTVADHNRAIHVENARQTISIAACFWKPAAQSSHPSLRCPYSSHCKLQ